MQLAALGTSERKPALSLSGSVRALTWGSVRDEPSAVVLIDCLEVRVPVEFLTDEQAAAYAAYRGAPSRAELERFFFLDDADRELIEAKRRAHNRLGFAVQLTTARYLGPVPARTRGCAGGGGRLPGRAAAIGDPSVLKEYGERDGTGSTMPGEIQRGRRLGTSPRSEGELRRVGGRAGLDDRRRAEGVVRRGGGVAAERGCCCRG